MTVENIQNLSSSLDRAITLAKVLPTKGNQNFLIELKQLSKLLPTKDLGKLVALMCDYDVPGVSEQLAQPRKERIELRKLLKSLPEEDVFKLLALMYLGRGDFDVPDLPEQLAELKTTFKKSANFAINQMMSKSNKLGEFLAEARSCLNAERVSLEDAFSSTDAARLTRQIDDLCNGLRSRH